ncbi:MAG: hypothetical protein K0S22_2118 [Oscillospiraceae bacterium]|jgi:hypothetical protein|nr:hypothetical protein [Oscillospiraceae bacterium]
MALYSFHGQIIGRGKSQNESGRICIGEVASQRSTSVAAVAYHAGTRLVDERTGEVYDYTKTTNKCCDHGQQYGSIWHLELE